MRIAKEALAKELNQMLDKARRYLSEYEAMTIEELNYKPASDKWSILECIEHLNRYGRYYIPEIRSQIKKSSHIPDISFKSGLLGNYFAESLRSKPELNKMRTFKSMNPAGSTLNKRAITELMEQVEALQEIIKRFAQLNLTKIKTGITISNWIKLRLGDTLRVVIYHIDRHIDQANRIY